MLYVSKIGTDALYAPPEEPKFAHGAVHEVLKLPGPEISPPLPYGPKSSKLSPTLVDAGINEKSGASATVMVADAVGQVSPFGPLAVIVTVPGGVPVGADHVDLGEQVSEFVHVYVSSSTVNATRDDPAAPQGNPLLSVHDQMISVGSTIGVLLGPVRVRVACPLLSLAPT